MTPAFEPTPEAEVAEAINLLAENAPLPVEWLASCHDREWPFWLELVHAVVNGHHTIPESGDTLRVQRMATTGRWRFEGRPPQVDATIRHPPLQPCRVAQLALGHGGVIPACAITRVPQTLEEAWLADAVWNRRFRAPDLSLVQPLVSNELRPGGFGSLALLRLWCVSTDNFPAARATVLRAPGAALLQIDQDFDDGLAQVQALLEQALDPQAPFALAWDLKPLADPRRGLTRPMPAVGGNSATAGLAFGALWVLRQHLRRDGDWPAIADMLDDCDPSRVAISAALEGPGPANAAAPLACWALAPVGGIDDKQAALAPALGRLPAGVGASGLELYRCRHQPGLAIVDGGLVSSDLGELLAKVSDRTGTLAGKPASRRLRRWLVDAPDDEAPDEDLLAAVSAEAPPGPVGYLLQCWARHAGGEAAVLGAPVRLAEHFVRLHMRSEDPRARVDDPTDSSTPRGPDQWDFPSLPALLRDADLRHKVPAFSLEAEPFTGKSTVLARYVMDCAREALREYRKAGRWTGIEIAVLLPMNRLGKGRATDSRLMTWLKDQAVGLAPWIDAMADPRRTNGLPSVRLRLLVDAVNELEAPGHDARTGVVLDLCDWLARLPRDRFLPPVISVRAREKPLHFASRDGRWSARTVELQSWRADEMRLYIRRRFPGHDQAVRRMLEALGLDPDTTDEALHGLDLTQVPLARFCSSPGILAAQCTLQLWRPGMSLPRHRADLLLALLWYSIARRIGELGGPLLSQDLRDDLAHLDRRRGWLLPADRGRLIDGMAYQATAMQDADGGMVEVVPKDPALKALARRLKINGQAAEQWLDAACRIGWVLKVREDPKDKPPATRLQFTHQQFRELCAALDLQPDQIADLAPPPLDPPDEAALLQRLAADKNFRLELPAANRHRERVRLAAATGDAEAWIRSLLARDLAMAARVAADLRERLEGEHWSSAWKTPHPLLQQIRRLLLLRAVDAGAEVKARVEASGLKDLMLKLKHCEGYEQAFGEAWQTAFREGVDIRQRQEAGLLLGELGDTVRPEWVETEVEGKVRRGLVLKRELWLDVSDRGQPMKHHLGDNQGEEDEKEFEIELDPFWLAKLPVTVAEWRAYLEDGDVGYERRPFTWDWSGHTNPLQAVSGISWHQARSYARWAGPLYARAWGTDFAGWQLALPDETQWEAGVRHSQTVGQPRLRWPYPGGEQAPDALCFNTLFSLWWRPSPVGVWSRGWSEAGVAEAVGGQRELCSNTYHFQAWREEEGKVVIHGEADPNDEAPRVLRGGGFRFLDPRRCRAGIRYHGLPSDVSSDVGLRLVLRRVPPH